MHRLTLLAVSLVVAVGALVAARESPHAARARGAEPVVVLRTVRVNVSTRGRPADGATAGAALSANGRYVAFSSDASTMVRSDLNDTSDVFVRDLVTSRTSRVSVSTAGEESNGASLLPSISADGRVVAFPSRATNLVSGDENAVQDVFARDRASGTTTRVSVGLDGEANGKSVASFVAGNGAAVVFSSEASNLVPGDRNGAMDVFVTQLASLRTSRVSVGVFGESAGRSEASAVSSNGRVVAFRSFSPNLVGRDGNGRADVFVHVRPSGATALENISSSGAQANSATFRGMLSGNGRIVGFRSRANNLVPGDTNGALDVFVHDCGTGRTTRISVASDGTEANATGFDRQERESLFMSRPFLSANGRYAAFTSRAPNLVPGDRNDEADVFVHDLDTGRTVRVSVGPGGREANGGSFVSGISADGRVVAFTSFATNLVRGDTNKRKDVFVAYLWPAPRGGLEALADPLGARARLIGTR